MNEKNYFTIVVPLSPDAQKIVQGNPSAVPLRAAVWSQASDRQGQGRTLDLAVQPAFGKQPISMPGKIKRRRSGAALRPFELWAEKLVSSILMKKRL